ncbi:MAG: carboxypeptidase-like regulatory domain-containing protein [Prevotellaceae bacterium]|jgi:hypothetical protein|nr:carboxypeptidase-like regulatory domain-containing protein [Prevotellaceae bacterium]
MKTKIIQTLACFFIFILVFRNFPLNAKDDNDKLFIISGIVKDKESNKKLANVSIFVPGTNIGTVTNSDGEFSIKIKENSQASAIEFVHIGYSNLQLPFSGRDIFDTTIFISPNAIVLGQAVIFGGDAQKLVKKAIEKVKDNYSNEENLLTGFYRETVQKRKPYISVSEAIIDVYKRPYQEDNGIDRERVQIHKGRQLLSQKAKDTLAVLLQGGPTLSVYLDIVKNPNMILNLETLSDYKFTIDGNIMMNEREHYIINFSPQVVSPYPLYEGKLYIEKESLTFSRAEFNMDMSDVQKVTSTVLRKKPARLRFKPEEVSFLVSYKKQGDKSYINYVKNNVRFKCDWKRKLFATNYTVVSEMVVIDRIQDNVPQISSKYAFSPNQSFTDKASDFKDADFWKEYNIIEPTESLELAVNKLRKQYK